MKEDLRIHFENLGLPPLAISWLLDLWDVIQALDDVADGDRVEDPESLPWPVLIGLPGNAFFQENAACLIAVVANMYLKWRAANSVEREGRPDEKSFVWRAAYYDVVLQVVLLCRGPVEAAKLAPQVMNLYGEEFEEYLKEFSHA